MAAHTCYDCVSGKTTYYMTGDRIAVFWPSMDETGAQKFVPCTCKYNDDFPALVVDDEEKNATQINTLFLKKGFRPCIQIGDRKYTHFTSRDENQQVYNVEDLSYFWIEAELDADAHPGLQNPIHAISGVRCSRAIRLGHRGLGSNKDYAEVNRDYLKLPYAVKQPIAENTLTAYRTACEKYGIDGVELDVILTKDRKCAVNHNFWIDYNGTHTPINALSLEQFKNAPLTRVFPRKAVSGRPADDLDLQRLKRTENSNPAEDAFEPAEYPCVCAERGRPELSDVLKTLPAEKTVNVEVKYPSSANSDIGQRYWARSVVVAEILRELSAHPRKSVCFSSFDPLVVCLLRSL